jgi:hypothetical protein
MPGSVPPNPPVEPNPPTPRTVSSSSSTRTHPFNNQLRNPLPDLNLKLHLAEIKQQNLHRPPVIRINNSRSHINAVLARQPAPGRYTTVGSCWHGNGNVCVDEHFAARRNGGGFRSVQVVAGGVGRTAGGCFGCGGEEFDLEGWRGRVGGESH